MSRRTSRSQDHPAPEPIRVAVVDDSAVYRHGIVRALHRDPRFEVVGFFDDGDVVGIAALDLDLVLVDYLLETTTGLDVVMGLQRAGVTAASVLISASLTDEIRERARRLGVRASLDKTLSRAEILEALVVAATPSHLRVV